MFHSVSLLSQVPLAHGSCALPSVLLLNSTALNYYYTENVKQGVEQRSWVDIESISPDGHTQSLSSLTSYTVFLYFSMLRSKFFGKVLS